MGEDHLDVRQGVEVVAVVDRAGFQAVMVAGDHQDGEGLFGQGLHGPFDGAGGGAVAVEQVAGEQHQVRVVGAHFFQGGGEGVAVERAAGGAHGLAVAAGVQVDVGAMGDAQAVDHGGPELAVEGRSYGMRR